MNKVIISGRLTKDIEKQTSKNDTEYVKFTVAVDKYAGKGKEKRTIFVDCMAFAHNANYLAKYCHKGNKVYVSGELDSNTVDKDGQKRTYWTVIVDSVEADTTSNNNNNGNQDSEDSMPFEM